MRMCSRLVLLAVMLVCTLACCVSSRAQDWASLGGRITDPNGLPVPKVQVQAINALTGVATSTETNDVGLYTLPSLPPGTYRIVIVKDGFAEIVKPGVELHTADSVAINFALRVGSVSEIVTVDAGAPLINTTDASVGTVVDRQFVENLPLNGRTFQQLITLAPGVSLIGSTGSAGAQPLGEFTVNGQRPTANYFTVDGVNANVGMAKGRGWGGVSIGGVENAAGGTNAMVSVDALQESRILTSSFAPEYGRTPGGQVILLTRSGTNQFHGSLYDYFRNTVLDANDWFANQAGQPRSPLQFNDFGGTFSGPIIKNRTFFFFSYEGQRLNQPQFSVTSVPDTASRLAASPATQFILNIFPRPNGPELGGGLAQFAAGYSNPLNTNATSIRVDHNFNGKLSVFARYSYSPSNSNARQPGNNLADAYSQSQLTQTLTGGATYAINPRLIDELRFNWSNNSITSRYTQDALGGAIPPSGSALFASPFSEVNAQVQLYTNWGIVWQGKGVDLEQRQVNLSDGFSWILGSHQLKFGFDYLRQLPINTGVPQYYYFFTDVPSLVDNTLSGAILYSNAPMHGDVTEFSIFAQDTWHASSRLALTYGLRWDFNPPPRSRYPNNQDYIPLSVDSAGNAVFGKAGSSYWDATHKNVAPRMGLAYTIRQIPGWDTVVRSGIGLFYDIGTEAAPLVGWNTYPAVQVVAPTASSFPIPPQQFALAPVDLSNPPPGSYFVSWPRNYSSPRTWEWNLSLQQALGSAQTLTVSYVGALGRNLVFGQFQNVGSQGYIWTRYSNSGTSDYNSLQLQFQRRLSRGLSATLAYTWAHSIDTNSDNLYVGFLPTSIANAGTNRGPSDFDIRHGFSGALSYSLPGYGTARWFAALSKGWGLDAIITARSALPVDVVDSRFVSALGQTYALRPTLIPGVPLYVAKANVPGGRVINAAAFLGDPNGNGNLGRNALRGFDLVETDLSARRSFHLSERFSLVFRADLFNLFNHPNFANPQSDLAGSFFGQSLAMANNSVGGSGSLQNAALSSAFQTGGPRTAQLSLKLQF